jgi:hypothetical protein
MLVKSFLNLSDGKSDAPKPFWYSQSILFLYAAATLELCEPTSPSSACGGNARASPAPDAAV